MTIQLEVVEDWVDTVVSVWADRLGSNPQLRMCLPTGLTPMPVYRSIAAMADFSDATVFLLDEFGLPPGDPARCDQMLRRDLLSGLETMPIVERLDPQAPVLDSECQRFASEIGDGGLDLIILGLGGNGHLGLNEPGSAPDATTRVVELVPQTRAGLARYGALSETDWGMTTGLAELLAGREIWLLVSGEEKREILKRFLEEPIGPDLPATWLRRHSNCVVWVDNAAGSGL